MNQAILITTLFLAASVLAPTVVATHATIHDSPVDDRYRRTLEDDQAIMRAPGTPFDGYSNKVVFPGTEIGDGGLFLDARLASRLGPWAMDEFPILFGSTFTEPVLGRSDVLVPGHPHTAYAWFGQWHDLNGNGLIDDLHDARAAATDEFRWRGLATGESVAVVQYLVPDASTSRASILANESHYDTDIFVDHTDTRHVEQYWSGPFTYSTEGSLLTHVQALVVAGAQASVGGAIKYDLDDPNALIDVDRYEAVSPEVGALISSTYTYAKARQAEADHLYATTYAAYLAGPVAEVLAARNETVADINAARNEIEAFVDSTTEDVRVPTVNPPYAREPNHPFDDYEERATYGGVGDRYGTGNQYPGYQDLHQFYADTYPFLEHCVGAYARVDATSVEISQGLTCNYSNRDIIGGTKDTRGTGMALGFTRLLGLWKDINLDGHVGAVCDPSTPDFDAHQNGCKNQGVYPYDVTPEAELVRHCETVQGAKGVVRVQPLDGDWSGAILIRNHRETTRAAFDPDTARLLEGREVVDIRWVQNCEDRVLDVILFPAGASPVALVTQSEYTLRSYQNHELGVTIGEQTVRDIDVIAATL